MEDNDDVFGDWDADFLELAIGYEERALASANATQLPKSQPPPVPLPPSTATPTAYRFIPPPAYAAYNTPNVVRDISYSPPRELSQRPSESNAIFALPRNAQEIEIERLKRELERVSSQVYGLEQECMELKRENDKQLKSVFSKAVAKKPEDNSMRVEISGKESDILTINYHGVSEGQGANTNIKGTGQWKCKGYQAIGIQTDHNGDLPKGDGKKEPNTDAFLQEKLQTIWSPTSGHSSRSFVTKLLLTCTNDFCDLFSYFGLKVSIRTTGSLERELSNSIVSESSIYSLHSAESTRISNLCSDLDKIRDGVIQGDAFFSIFLDLCTTEDVSSRLQFLTVILKMDPLIKKVISLRKEWFSFK